MMASRACACRSRASSAVSTTVCFSSRKKVRSHFRAWRGETPSMAAASSRE